MNEEERLAAIGALSETIQSLSGSGSGSEHDHWQAVARLQGALMAMGLESLTVEESSVAAAKRGFATFITTKLPADWKCPRCKHSHGTVEGRTVTCDNCGHESQ